MVAPNVVTISANPKEEGLHLQWRAYLLDNLRCEAEWIPRFGRAECVAFRRVFIPFVCRSPWGAISAAALPCLVNSIEFTVPRIEAVLRHWEALDTLKYVDFDERPISLAKFMSENFHGNVAMWVDQPTGDIRTDLATAIAEMRQASDDEIYRRLLKRLRDCVDIKTELQHREWLKSPGVIEAELEADKKANYEWYDWLTGGHHFEHGRFLSGLDRDYVPPVQ